MTKKYIISDTHFGHKKIIEYCHRPVNFNELLMEGLMELPDDCLLIHLGDFAFAEKNMYSAFMRSLPYKKVLIRGNHDHESVSKYMADGWDFCCDMFSIKTKLHEIVFSHRPIKIEPHQINVHGHLHNAEQKIAAQERTSGKEAYAMSKTDRHFNFACEETDYKPVLLEKFVYGRV